MDVDMDTEFSKNRDMDVDMDTRFLKNRDMDVDMDTEFSKNRDMDVDMDTRFLKNRDTDMVMETNFSIKPGHGQGHGHGKYEWWSKYGFICGIILVSYIFDKFSSNIWGIKVNGPEILMWAVLKDESVD